MARPGARVTQGNHPVRIIAASFGIALVAAASPTGAVDPGVPYQHLVGALHNHSGYSDGWPGTTPATYFEKGKGAGLDFMGSGEHSDNADVPVTFSEGCLGAAVTECVGRSPDSVRKWQATSEQADAATTDGFTAFRGFEWTSDRFGHINVYFSEHDTNAKADGGYTAMETFWKWFDTAPGLQGGGADGLATFNHPGSKSLDDADPAFNWNDFEYVPSADHRMVGLEVFNDDDEFATTRGPGPGFYVHVLDKGWHVGAIGAEDLHGIPNSRDDYGSSRWAKTVILAKDRSVASLRSAMLARRFYALRRNDGLRLAFSADGQPMGSRLVREPGDAVHVVASTNRPQTTIEVVTSGGRVVATGTEAIDTSIGWGPADRYYFMRVKEGTDWVAYSSPVWVTAAPATQGEWLAGDLHVHTCYSHDAYCPHEGDDNTGPEDFYTFSGNVEERFIEASARGLDYLAITDHNDVRSVTHPGFGSHGVIGIPGYEDSIGGHAQMLGAKRIYDGDRANDSDAEIAKMADALRADGGLFQANHPADGLTYELDEECSDTSGLHWRYDFDVPVDTVEVWNISQLLQRPVPAGTSNQDAVRYWECWLDRGARVGATGGSDSHWLSTAAVQGPGNPTTWVFAADRSPQSILDAIREGRTSVSLVPPVLGGLRLHLEADADGDDHYEAIVGDEVEPGTKMRVRADGLPGAGLVEVRANGETIVDDELLAPDGALTFTSPQEPGWVRATLSGPDLRDERSANCDPVLGDRTSYCRNRLAVLALTSAIYLREAPPTPTVLTYTGETRVKGNTAALSALLTTDAGAPVEGKEVMFTNDDIPLAATTDVNGVAATTMSFLGHRKTEVVDIAFAGDERFLPSQTSVTLTWAKPPRT